MSVPTIRTATAPSDLAAVRSLCRAYRDELLSQPGPARQVAQLHYAEPGFSRLLATLPDRHAPPCGVILLAELNGQPVGCGMSQRISADLAEIKRLYVARPARGLGLGARLCEALCAEIRTQGYGRVALDTARSLTWARALYERLGFQPRGPFAQTAPDLAPLLCFYERTL